MSLRTILMVVVITSSVAVVGVNTATADHEKWEGPSCDAAPVINEGTHTGIMESSSDRDRMNIRMSQGDYIDVTVETPDEAQNPRLLIHQAKNGEEIEIRGLQNGGVDTGRSSTIIYPNPGETVTFELWAKQDIEPMCVAIFESDWETEYNWELSYEREYPDVTLYEVRELEDEVAELRSQNNSETTTNNEEELQEQLEEREERIDELESQVTELEAELEDENEVVFNIDVSPRTGEQFKVGGHAAISVDPKTVEHTTLQDLQIIHKNEEYTVDHNGQGSIPLEEAGEHEITFQYEDTTETVVLTAVEDTEEPPADTPEETSGTPNPNDGGETSENGNDSDTGIGDELTFWAKIGIGMVLVAATVKQALAMYG